MLHPMVLLLLVSDHSARLGRRFGRRDWRSPRGQTVVRRKRHSQVQILGVR